MNTLKFGNGEWYGKKDTILAYNDENSNYKPLPFDFSRASSATIVNKDGLIETVGSGQPRIDYKDDSKGALLLEPSRTNSLLQSNQFDTTWTLSVSIDLTSGQNGVFGSNDAWLLKRNSTGSRYVQQSLSLSSATYSYSVYLKAESTNWAYVYSYDGSASVNAYFDLENGVVGNTTGSNLDSATIESVGNGWYRCILTYTQPTTLVRIYPAYSNGSVSTGTDNGIYIQNAQVEQGSYATSYIPTQGSTVTRLADSCSDGANEQVINSTEGVLYFEGSAIANDGTFKRISIGTSDNLFTNSIQLRYNTTNNSISYQFRVGNVYQADITISANTTNINKIACVWKINRFEIWVNGVKKAEDTLGSVPSYNTFNSLFFGKSSIGLVEPFYGNLKDLRVYNTALTDQELIALTS